MILPATTPLARVLLALACGSAALLGAPDGAAGEADLAVARAARPSVVRVRWRDVRFPGVTAARNAVVVRKDGLLLMAGPPPSRHGTLSVTLHDGREMRARLLAGDVQTALSLLRVPTTGLEPLAVRTPQPVERIRPVASEDFQARPLVMPKLGLRVVMVTGDDAVAVGAIRSWGRYGTVVDPASGRRLRSTGLVGAAMAAVDTDAGSPLLDADGRIVGLMVGRRATKTPEAGVPPPRPGLTQRPEPVEAVAVPACVIRVVLPLLENLGRVPKAALGVTTRPIDEQLRTQLGLAAGGHVLQSLEPSGAAARAGLHRLDLIVGVNGVPIRPGTTLHDVLLPYRPQSRVRLDIIRAGRRLRVPVTLASR